MVAVAEMCIASGLGATIPLAELPREVDPFAEMNGCYILSVDRTKVVTLIDLIKDSAVAKVIGDASPDPHLIAFRSQADACDVPISELTQVWRGTLDW